MSVQSQAEFNAVSNSAAQAIASALPKLDKPHNCAKNHSFSRADTSRLKTCSSFDMKVKGAWRARRDLYRSLSLTPTGRISFAAADLYEDILDLWQSENRIQNFNHRDGCYYWGRPIAKWAKKYGCTEDQFDGWLKILRGRGLIATCMMKTKTNMLQIRPLVAEGSACLSGWPDSPNYAYLLEAETQAQQGPAGSFGPNAAAAKQPQCTGGNLALTKDLGLHVGVACTGLKDFVDASLSTKASTGNSTNESGTINPEVKPQTQNVTPDAVSKSRKFCTATKKNSAGLLWLSLVTQYMPEHDLTLKKRDWKIVRDLCDRIDSMTDLPGHEQVLRWAIRYWLLWAKSIGYADQVSPAKLTTVLDTALAEYRKERAALIEKAAYKAEKAAQMLKAHADIAALKAAQESAPAPVKKPSQLQQHVADEAAKKASKQPATPTTEPVMTAGMPEVVQPVIEAVAAPECPAIVQVVQVGYMLTADDYEECPEPPLESERCALTPNELRALDIAKQKAKQQAKAKATGANMFKHKAYA